MNTLFIIKGYGCVQYSTVYLYCLLLEVMDVYSTLQYSVLILFIIRGYGCEQYSTVYLYCLLLEVMDVYSTVQCTYIVYY